MKHLTLVAVCVLGAAVGAAPMVRLDNAEVGFRMHMGVMKSPGLDVTSGEMASLTVVTNGAVVTGTWKGHALFGDDFTVLATFERQDGGWTYSLRWEELDGWKFFVERVTFPDLVVPRTLKTGALQSESLGMGMVRHPDWRQVMTADPIVVSAMREFQFVALLDDEIDSWYLDARDPLARYKTSCFCCRGGDDRPRASIGITALLPAVRTLTTAGALPWKGFFRPFRGGWWEAAQIYRPWALQQAWAVKAKARRQDPSFAKWRDIGFWAWNRGGCETVARPLELFAAEADVPCALHWDWWHRYEKDVGYPTYWPPYEGVDAFTATVAALKKANCRTMVYVNGMSRDRDDASWAQGGEAEAQVEHDGIVHGHHWNPHTLDPHRLTTVCGTGTGFQRLIGDVVGHLAKAGVDAVYLDQVSCAAAGPCWSDRHGHPKGDVVASLDGYHRFLAGLRAQEPGLRFGSEEVSEAFLGDCDIFISLFGTSYERCRRGTLPEAEAVPVWNALYHGLASVFGSYLLIDGIPPWDDDRWPAERKWRPDQEKDWRALFPDQFAVEFARTVAWGNQPTAHALRLEHMTSPKFAAERRFMVEAARFYHANRDWLFDGEMLCPGRLACATKEVRFQLRGIYSPAGEYDVAVQPALPVVFHNVWKSPDGRIAAILVNWSREPQPYALTTPYGACEGVIPPLACLNRPLAGKQLDR